MAEVGEIQRCSVACTCLRLRRNVNLHLIELLLCDEAIAPHLSELSKFIDHRPRWNCRGVGGRVGLIKQDSEAVCACGGRVVGTGDRDGIRGLVRIGIAVLPVAGVGARQAGNLEDDGPREHSRVNLHPGDVPAGPVCELRSECAVTSATSALASVGVAASEASGPLSFGPSAANGW